MVGVAVNVADAPAQMVGPGDTPTMTEAGAAVLIVIVSEFEVAGLPVAQDNEDVMVHVTTSPLFSVDEEYTALVAPVTGEPFIFH